jgi:capsular polysaccharide export protein
VQQRGEQRSFLFLQGVNTPFFAQLRDQLVKNGHRVFRVNFNTGDTVYWGQRAAWAFRGKLDSLPDFLNEKIHKNNITDILLFGDRRPIHQPAIEIAKRKNIRTHVFEEGYFRPYWVTLERNGVNANSLFPRDPAWIRNAAKSIPDYGNGQPFAATLRIRALHDMAYHLSNIANPLMFPRYRTHRPVISGLEYAGWGQRFAKMPIYERRDRETIQRLLNGNKPFYLLPLQLDSDTQIRDHSPFDDMGEVIKLTVSSFARHTPSDARLVIKNHPLDTGFVNYPRLIKKLENEYHCMGRIDYLESGDLEVMLQKARGLVTVNSTVGLSSLGHNCPTIALSNPIYNIEGLTFRGTLDQFWRDGAPPDAPFFRQFRNTLIHTTQINGGFYSAPGIELAVANSVRVLESALSPLEALL